MDALRSHFKSSELKPTSSGIAPPEPWEFELLVGGASELFNPEREAAWRARAKQLAMEKVILQRSLLEMVGLFETLRAQFDALDSQIARVANKYSLPANYGPQQSGIGTINEQLNKVYSSQAFDKNAMTAFAKEYWSGVKKP